MTITEQARAAAEEVANWMNWKKDVHPYAHEQNIETLTKMLTPYIQPATVTEAIEEVRRLRDEADKHASRDAVWAWQKEAYEHAIDTLESLQGKAGVNELRKWRCNNCWNVNVQQPCAKCGRPEEVAVLPPHAATTPASVEAKLCSICIAAGRVYCPPEHRQAYDITGEELTTTAPPEQQSPRVCVSGDGDKSESD